MSFVFISPHFPPNLEQFITALRAREVNVLGIGDAPYHVLDSGLRKALVEYYYAPDMNQYEVMYRAVAHLAAKHSRIERIESMNEYWLEVEARLRRDFNVPGPTPADLERSRRKLGMKEVFRQHGIPCADGERVTDAKRIEAFVARVGYPVIFKPDIGVGADRTFVVSKFDELKPHLENPPRGFLMEEFVKGELVSFDGLTDENGEILFSTSMTVNAGIMEIVQQQLEMFYYYRRGIPAALEALGHKTVKAFDVRNRFFHTEFLKQGEHEYTALEINVRPPGGYSIDLMNYQCDFNLYQTYADLVAGEKPSLDTERKYCVAHAARRHGHNYRHSHDELLHCLGDKLVAHMAMPDVFSAAMGNYGYVIRDADENALRASIAMVQEVV